MKEDPLRLGLELGLALGLALELDLELGLVGLGRSPDPEGRLPEPMALLRS